MAEDHPEELPETSAETHEVAAAVPLDELRRLDDSGDIADQLRTVLDGQRTMQHDVTVLSGLLPTVAHAQTSILDQINALDANLRGLGRVLAGFVERMDAIEASIERWETSRLASATAPR
jgi:hypothetical protein